jgi:RecJ-like exonuclease
MGAIILTHGDSDGICSGALALAANEGAKVYFTNPISILDDLDMAEGADRIIVCDIAIDRAFSNRIKKRLDTLSRRTSLVYIDHHPLPPGFQAEWLVHDPLSCASLLTYAYFSGHIDPDMSRVAMYGAIGDYRDDAPLAAELSEQWDKRSLYYEAGTLSQGIEIGRRDYNYKRSIALFLSRNVLPSEIEGLAKHAIEASHLENELRLRIRDLVVRMRNLSYVIDPDGFISKAAIYARVYGHTPVGVACEYHGSKDAYDISARSTGDQDLNYAVSMAASKYGGTGGGHPNAAGGRIPASRLTEFLAYLDALLGEHMDKNKAPGIIDARM